MKQRVAKRAPRVSGKDSPSLCSVIHCYNVLVQGNEQVRPLWYGLPHRYPLLAHA